jgi:hypothetical protein
MAEVQHKKEDQADQAQARDKAHKEARDREALRTVLPVPRIRTQ